MEAIRLARLAPGYAPGQRHCMYGLDADLVMLSLVTHEPNFCLLREVVRFGGGGGAGQPSREALANPSAEHFILFQIGLLRDYLDAEFKTVAAGLPFPYDGERVVDDFVLFCMLIGNDFLPPLPTLDINEGALDTIFRLYKQLLPKLGGYLTKAGALDRGRLAALLAELGALEGSVLADRARDADEHESRGARRGGRGGRGGGRGGARAPAPPRAPRAAPPPAAPAAPPPPSGFALRADDAGDDDDDAPPPPRKPASLDPDAAPLAAAAADAAAPDLARFAALEGDDAGAAPAAPTMMSTEARAMFAAGDAGAGLAAWTERYWTRKLECRSPADRRAVADHFLAGLTWVLEYYYRGVARWERGGEGRRGRSCRPARGLTPSHTLPLPPSLSWTWYYPHHYAPTASELAAAAAAAASAKARPTFARGAPFTPFQQLLAVLPAASASLLPAPYRRLMTEAGSPVADFYPTDFDVDMEGKRADWEGVVKIPFVDEARLLAAAATVPKDALSPAERARDAAGVVYVFSAAGPGAPPDTAFCETTLPSSFATVDTPNSICRTMPPPPPLPDGAPGFDGRPPGGAAAKNAPPAPGFATLRGLPASAELKAVGANVLGLPSKRESLILQPKAATPTRGGAPALAAAVGTRCWVKWPYLVEALVVAVSDGSVKVTGGGSTPISAGAGAAWRTAATALSSDLLTKRGIDVGAIDVLLHVRPVDGLVRAVDGSVEKRWSAEELAVPPALALRKNPAPDARLDPVAAAAAASALGWPPGSRALFLGRAYYGAPAFVLPSGAAAAGGDGARAPAAGLRVLVHPPSAASAAAAAVARRILASVKVTYAPSGAAARRLGVTPRALGRVTGPLFASPGPGRDSRADRVDVGLCVKHGARGLCVPDFVAPAPPRPGAGPDNKGGWCYSPALVSVLAGYKARHPWVFALADAPHEASASELASLVPGDDADAKAAAIAAAAKWLKSQPLASRPLVSVDADVAPEAAIRALQAALPAANGAAGAPRSAAPTASSEVELDNVAPALLLPPTTRGGVVDALVGGTFAVGDRVACVKADGGPPFGARGTVVGAHDDALEILLDAPFPGGDDLHGRCDGAQGAVLAPAACLNLSRPHAIAATGAAAPRVVRRGVHAAPAPGAPPRAPQRSVALAHEPACPPEAGAKGFSRGRGRGREAVAPAPPGGRAAPTLAAAVRARTASAAASASLLQRLQQAQPPQAPAPVSGAALLSALRQGPGAAPPPPPPAPVAPDASSLPALPASLMRGLAPPPPAAAKPRAAKKKAAPASAQAPPPPAAPQPPPPPAAAGGKGLAGLWARLSGKPGPVAAAEPPASTAPKPAPAPTPAPAPPASGEADFWAALQAKK